MPGPASSSLFWDSCVVIRYLTGIPPEGVADIDLYLSEAKAGTRRIYGSSMIVAEVKPNQLQQRGFASFQDLIDDLQGSLILINPNMPILMQAARLRNFSYMHEQPQRDEKARILTGMDSVHLATCLYVRHVLGVVCDFHTFDDGKGRNYEEKAVSLLNFQKYCTQHTGDADIDAVCALNRCKPEHPERPLL